MCGEIKHISDFPRQRSSKYGIKPRCLDCNNKEMTAWKNTESGKKYIESKDRSNENRTLLDIQYKCKQCGKLYFPKSAERKVFCSRKCYFAYKRGRVKGRICKHCNSEYKCTDGHIDKTYCIECSATKPHNDFTENRICRKCGCDFIADRKWKELCNTCGAGLSKESHRYYRNRIENNERKRIKNQGKRLPCRRCGEKVTGYGANYCDECLPFMEISRHVSRVISKGMQKALKHRKNGRSWSTLVNYDTDDLVSHLESQFRDGMTWDNYGPKGWHVDHVIPKSWFNFNSPDDGEFKQCWALANLQPLWSDENIAKSNRWAG